MKIYKLLFALTLLASSQIGWADQIITVENDTIECKIEMAGQGIVSYRPANNLKGSVQHMLKSKVLTINYGDIPESALTATNEKKYTVDAVEEKQIEDKCASKSKGVTYSDYKLYRNGSPLNRKETYDVINCYQTGCAGSYYRYCRMKNSGIVLTAIGAALTGLGVYTICDAVKELDDDGSEDDVLTFVGGYLSADFGVCAMGTGIPLAIIGSKRKKQRVRMFNDNYLNKQSSYEHVEDGRFQLGLTTGKNKIGIGLTF